MQCWVLNHWMFYFFMSWWVKQYIGFSTYMKKIVLIYLDCWRSVSIFLHDFPWFSAKQKKEKTHNSDEPTTFTTLPTPLFQMQRYNITPQIMRLIHETSESHHQHHHHHEYPKNEQKRHPDHHHHDGGGASWLLDEALWDARISLQSMHLLMASDTSKLC